MSEKVLTARQIAERYEVAPSTARAWFLRGLVPGAYLKETDLGSYWVVPEGKLKDFTKPKPGPQPKAKSEGAAKRARKDGRK